MKLNLKNRLTYFIDNGYLHGLRYLGERCGYFGKIFWLTVMIISAWQMSRIFILTFESFQNDATSINVDTSYLHWNNTFPAISICSIKGGSSNAIREFLNDYWQANNLTQPPKVMSYVKLLQSYLFQSPNQPIEEFDTLCHNQNATCGMNLEVLERLFFPRSCRAFMRNLTFLGKRYDCEELFKFQKTEMGNCFIANSLHTNDFDYLRLPLKYDRETTNRILEFTYLYLETVQFNLYIHSPEDLPYFNANSYILRKSDGHVTYLFNIIEMSNQPDVIDLPIEKRQCRFPKERIDNINSPYSFSACFLDLRVQVEMENCNCTIHTSPEMFKEQYCDFQGLKCIKDAEINNLAKDLHYQEGTQCAQSCLEMDISSVGEIQVVTKTKGEPASVKIEILNNPTLRYIRRVARTDLDLVVTIGGVFGLFFGASILTFFQFVYIWIVRKF